MPDIVATTALAFAKGLITPFAIAPGQFSLLINGLNAIKKTETVGVTDGTVDLGAVSILGCVAFHNTQPPNFPPSTDPVITQAGAAGTNNDTYVLVFRYNDASLSVGNPINTALANATLDGTNYNILTWTNPSGVVSVDAYRTLADGTPATLGKIGTAVTSPFHDTGLAGDGSDVPVGVVSNFPIVYGGDGTDYPNQIWGGEAWAHRWNGVAIHRKALVIPTTWEYLVIDQ